MKLVENNNQFNEAEKFILDLQSWITEEKIKETLELFKGLINKISKKNLLYKISANIEVFIKNDKAKSELLYHIIALLSKLDKKEIESDEVRETIQHNSEIVQFVVNDN